MFRFCLLMIAFALCLLSGCQRDLRNQTNEQAPQSPEDGSLGESTQVKPDPLDSAQPEVLPPEALPLADQAEASPPAVQTLGDAGSTRAAPELPALLITLHNDSAQPRFLAEPGMGPRLRCRLLGEQAEDCLAEAPFCLEACPEDGSRPVSKRCAKPSDKLRPIAPGERYALSWDRKLRRIKEQHGVACFELFSLPEEVAIELELCSHETVHTLTDAAAEDKARGLSFTGKPTDEARCQSVRVTAADAGPIVLAL